MQATPTISNGSKFKELILEAPGQRTFLALMTLLDSVSTAGLFLDCVAGTRRMPGPKFVCDAGHF